MKNNPRLTPLFVALSVVLSALPQAALAQVAMRPMSAPGAVSAAANAGAPSAVTALPALAPLSALSAAAAPAAPLAPALTPAAVAAAASLPVFSAESIEIPTPGAAATGIAAEAASYAGDHSAPVVAAAAAPAKGLVGRLADVVLRRSSVSALFDASGVRPETSAPIFGRMGLQEHKPILLPNGTRTDDQPTTPSPDREPSVRLQTFSLPGARDVGGVLESSRKVLNANPNDVGSVVAAVKAMIDADRARFGVSSSELRLIGARRFDGHGELADTVYVHFRQVKDGLLVNGSNLSFTMKVIDGKPMVVAQTGQIFPQIDVDTQATLTDEQIMGKIAERIGMPVADATSAFQFLDEKIVYSRGAWRHVKLYVADGLPIMIAVDMANGLVFAWDDRAGLKSAKKDEKKASPAVSGSVGGMAIDHGPILPGAPIVKLPLSYLNVTIGGKTYTTDKDGKFSAPDLEIPAGGLDLTAALSGPYVNILDTTGKTEQVAMKLMPGDDGIAVLFNPGATIANENALSQVSAFHKVNLAYNFLKARSLTTERMDKEPLKVVTNVDEECNADYSPGTDTMRNFKSSANCVNSSYDTVDDHEYGHRWDHMTGGIMNGGLSEGWGDTLSMYLLNNPVIGEHFLKTPGADGKDYIRHGENTYQYNEFDEVHAQGQAWGGFTWKFRKALMQQLGDAAGAAMAEAIVLPTMFAKAATIPDAIAQVLVAAMKKDGTLQFEGLIRSTAQIHGITLPTNPGKTFVESLVERFTSPLRRISGLSGFEQELQGVRGAAAHGAIQDVATASIRMTRRFSAGAMIRGRVANEIRRYMDETGLKYKLNEYKGWFSSDFLLVIEGPQDQVQEHADNISRWLSAVASN